MRLVPEDWVVALGFRIDLVVRRKVSVPVHRHTGGEARAKGKYGLLYGRKEAVGKRHNPGEQLLRSVPATAL